MTHIDNVGIERVANGYIIKVHNQWGLSKPEVYTNLSEALTRIAEFFCERHLKIGEKE